MIYYKHVPLTLDDINSKTYYNTHYNNEAVEFAENLKTDPKKKERVENLLCKRCYYRGGTLAGQSFVTYHCGICEAQDTHPNTASPRLCTKCAETHKLCVDCGGDLQDKKRKKL